MTRWKSSSYYNVKKVEVDGITFDSKLELYMYKLLKTYNIPFDFQYFVELQERFKLGKKIIRPITLTIDFVVRLPKETIYLDTKGFAIEVAKIKYKMLKYRLRNEKNIDVVFVKDRGECSRYALELLAKYKE